VNHEMDGEIKGKEEIMKDLELPPNVY